MKGRERNGGEGKGEDGLREDVGQRGGGEVGERGWWRVKRSWKRKAGQGRVGEPSGG